MQSFEGREPELTFPCEWSYTLFGRDEAALRAVAAEVVGEREHRMELSNRSAKGTYCSVQLEVVVTSREEQRGLFAQLQKHEVVAYLL